MNRFWEPVIRPCLELIKAKHIVEIGSDYGVGTKKIIDYCREYNGTIVSIDPFPKYDEEVLMKANEGVFTLYRDLSLNRLPLLQNYDAILVDGDHNWYTVYSELKIIAKTFKGKTMPLIFVHDIGWPYARRDLYYNPDNIPVGYRQPHQKKGMLPTSLNLVQKNGLNEHLDNAIYQNSLNNGVLTAVEDAIKDSFNSSEVVFIKIPGMFGLGIIASKEAHREVIELIQQNSTLTNTLEMLENERINTLLARAKSKNKNKELESLNQYLVNKNEELENDKKEISDSKDILEGRINIYITEKEQMLSEIDLRIKDIQILEDRIKLIEVQKQDIESITREQVDTINQLEAAIEKKSDMYSELMLYLKEVEKISSQKYTIKDIEKIKAEAESRRIAIEDEKDILTFQCERYKQEAKLHQNSIRYQLGHLIITSNSLKSILALPKKVKNLYKEAKKRQDNKVDIGTKKIDIPKKNDIQNQPARVDIKQDNYQTKRIDTLSNIESMKAQFTPREGIEFYSVDVIICVHNALEDVKECILSVMNNNTYHYNLIIVDDGSKTDTQVYLQRFCQEYEVTLIRNNEAQGYTIAANQGLRKSTADFVILLNSDTIVTSGWVEKMVEGFEKNPQTGIMGPLSNAASWQTVPEIHENGDWKVNTLPEGMNIEFMNKIVEMATKKEYPKVSVLNGFCFMIARRVIDTIGYLDEETFPTGYGEENDYCIRAKKSGFELRVLDNTYIFHEKSKSFTHETRRMLSKKATEKLKNKYSTEEITNLSNGMKENEILDNVRMCIKIKQLNVWCQYKKLVNKKILFILPVKGGSGGANSVIQELLGMRSLGIEVNVITSHKKIIDFRKNYPDIEKYTLVYKDEKQLIQIAREYDIVIATIFTSVSLLNQIVKANHRVVPCYYVQDYEPYFFDSVVDKELYQEAYASYKLIPNNHLFAKTHWIGNEVKNAHDVEVAKVTPSIDTRFYNPYTIKKKELGQTIRVCAMVRMSTPRRRPEETLALLKRLKSNYPQQVEIVIFGSSDEEIDKYQGILDMEYNNQGILKRWEVANLLLNSDIFIDMSTYQAFGRTGLEGMALGCVPVLPKEGGVYEYAVNGENAIVVDTSDINAVYQSICGIMEDRSLLENMKNKGMQTARDYSIINAAWSELEFFNTIIE